MIDLLKPDIPCMCAVDRQDMGIGGGIWRWQVIVRTAPFWHFQARKIYFIEAASDTLAALEGIRRFVEEDKLGTLKPDLQRVH